MGSTTSIEKVGPYIIYIEKNNIEAKIQNLSIM